MVIQGLKEVCLIDKSVNNHPTQSVNNHNLDNMRRPYTEKQMFQNAVESIEVNPLCYPGRHGGLPLPKNIIVGVTHCGDPFRSRHPARGDFARPSTLQGLQPIANHLPVGKRPAFSTTSWLRHPLKEASHVPQPYNRTCCKW